MRKIWQSLASAEEVLAQGFQRGYDWILDETGCYVAVLLGGANLGQIWFERIGEEGLVLKVLFYATMFFLIAGTIGRFVLQHWGLKGQYNETAIGFRRFCQLNAAMQLVAIIAATGGGDWSRVAQSGFWIVWGYLMTIKIRDREKKEFQAKFKEAL